eukprot:TRINITY_DN1207_c0_g1_i1.p1 TRINITY_DN1207_c0_g1~~TRINITY_DN1207_c0_g1_i1.p1  ORF type:complete len:307 (-),score=54.74 TRINITY_DN1207_c0_g1_i1:39-926(-)
MLTLALLAVSASAFNRLTPLKPLLAPKTAPASLSKADPICGGWDPATATLTTCDRWSGKSSCCTPALDAQVAALVAQNLAPLEEMLSNTACAYDYLATTVTTGTCDFAGTSTPCSCAGDATNGYMCLATKTVCKSFSDDTIPSYGCATKSGSSFSNCVDNSNTNDELPWNCTTNPSNNGNTCSQLGVDISTEMACAGICDPALTSLNPANDEVPFALCSNSCSDLTTACVGRLIDALGCKASDLCLFDDSVSNSGPPSKYDNYCYDSAKGKFVASASAVVPALAMVVAAIAVALF